jgi:hypothetical protein
VLDVNHRRWRIGSSLAIAVMSLIFGNGCVATDPAERMETVVIGSNHPHSAEILKVTVVGRVPDNGRKISVTAKFSESEPKLDRLSIVDPDGKTIVVPRSYFEKVLLPQEQSLSLGYLMAGDSKTVAEIHVFLDFGDLRRRADLKCTNDSGDPVFETFKLFYDPRARTFETRFEDYCGEPISE